MQFLPLGTNNLNRIKYSETTKTTGSACKDYTRVVFNTFCVFRAVGGTLAE